MPKQNISVILRLPSEVYEAAKRIASAERRSVNGQLRVFIENEINLKTQEATK